MQEILVDVVLVYDQHDISLEVFIRVKFNLISSDVAEAIAEFSQLCALEGRLECHYDCIVLDPNVFCQALL